MQQRIIPEEEENLQDVLPEEEELLLLLPDEDVDEEDPVDEPPHIGQESVNADSDGEEQQELMDNWQEFTEAIGDLDIFSNRIMEMIQILKQILRDGRGIFDEDSEDM